MKSCKSGTWGFVSKHQFSNASGHLPVTVRHRRYLALLATPRAQIDEAIRLLAEAPLYGVAVAFWWVNQKQTWRHEIAGEYLWSPKLDKRGRHLEYYDNMERLRAGDIVFSYINGTIQYAGVVVGLAESSRRPDFGFTNTQWNDDGWSVEMRYVPIAPIRPQDHLDFYLQVAPARHAPMNPEGVVISQYLFAIPDSLGAFYLQVAELTEHDVRDVVRYEPLVTEVVEEAEEILADPSLTTTERRQLVRARVGQGLFKEKRMLPLF